MHTDYSGGFIVLRNPIIRSGMHAHTSAIDAPVSALDLEALNALQGTPWRINARILDTQRAAFVAEMRIPGVPVEVPLSPVKGLSYLEWQAQIHRTGSRKTLPDAVWAGMSPEDRKTHIQRVAEIHSENVTIRSRKFSFLDALSVAEELRNETAIYYPHNRCFRGRLYPMVTSGPSPQGNDQNKALLQFAEGMELGAQGLYWLLVRAANSAGKDKMRLDERVGWAVDNRDNICASAADPLGFLWWSEQDEPWGLLATCFELADAWALDDPTKFVSHLPVPLDGTCNGLQHLSAMALDPVGATATNLSCSPDRKDIYMDVAAAVREQILADVLEGNELAVGWMDKFSEPSKARKIVKRAVMTTPYGVTDRGIRDQILNEGHTEGFEGAEHLLAANYIRDAIMDALTKVSGPAKEIMAWLRTVASLLAREELPFDWTTPSGSKVRQAYYTATTTKMHTLSGRITLVDENCKAQLHARKQAAGAPPNYVHSFDAAHLAMTVERARAGGVQSFAMIHDSYGTHAALTGRLSTALRETFVEIYRKDWLAELYETVTAYAPHVELPRPPPRGEFDISEVLRSEFFFS